MNSSETCTSPECGKSASCAASNCNRRVDGRDSISERMPAKYFMVSHSSWSWGLKNYHGHVNLNDIQRTNLFACHVQGGVVRRDPPRRATALSVKSWVNRTQEVIGL